MNQPLKTVYGTFGESRDEQILVGFGDFSIRNVEDTPIKQRVVIES